MAEDFEIIGQITETETIAIGTSIRELPELRARFGRGRWRKLKGVADVRSFRRHHTLCRSSLV